MITIKDVEHVAKLARLEVTEAEKELYTKQLGDVLKYVDQMNEVDTSNVKPMTQVIDFCNVIVYNQCNINNETVIIVNGSKKYIDLVNCTKLSDIIDKFKIENIRKDGIANTIDGGSGDDTLIGGTGADTFNFIQNEGYGIDTVKNYTSDDVLRFESA